MTSVVGNPMANRDQQIADLAYRFWEEEGYPHDRAEAHWLRAVEFVDGSTLKKKLKATAAPKSRKKAS